jgi:excisionase family DNA binding protein
MDIAERKNLNMATDGNAGSHPTQSFYIDLKELSRRLSLSVRTIRTLISDPVCPIPTYRVGGKYLFCWREVDMWIRQFRIQPVNVQDILNNIFSQKE